MKKIFVINGAQSFDGFDGGTFNEALVDVDREIFTQENGFLLKVTKVAEDYRIENEIEKYVWADVIIYHFPVWWFGLPHRFKQYVDNIFMARNRKDMFYKDGHNKGNLGSSYSTNGKLHGRRYLVTTSWNAPETPFILPGEFFLEANEDAVVLFDFHRTNAFLGLERFNSIHFHDLGKNETTERLENYKNLYLIHLQNTIETEKV